MYAESSKKFKEDSSSKNKKMLTFLMEIRGLKIKIWIRSEQPILESERFTFQK